MQIKGKKNHTHFFLKKTTIAFSEKAIKYYRIPDELLKYYMKILSVIFYL